MIVTERYNERLTRTYSDANMYIERDNVLYEDAIDPTELGRIYTETNIPIDHNPEDEATSEDYEEALREVGVLDEEE